VDRHQRIPVSSLAIAVFALAHRNLLRDTGRDDHQQGVLSIRVGRAKLAAAVSRVGEPNEPDALIMLDDDFAETGPTQGIAGGRQIGGVVNGTDEHAIEFRAAGLGDGVSAEAFFL